MVLVLLLLVGAGVMIWRKPPTEVTQAKPGVPWRVAGGVGSRTVAPTVEGAVVPSWFGQRGAPVRRVAGRVTYQNQPVAGAAVELASELTDVGILPKIKRITGPDGKFDFGTQPPAKLSVAAMAQERAPAILEVDARDPSAKTDQLELRLGDCGSALFGHISDAAGGAIPAAEVCLAPPRASACVTADEKGAYSMCLTTRQEFVTVAARGYGAIWDRVWYEGRRMQRDYQLTPEATVFGKVMRADTNAVVAGATVRIEAFDKGFQRSSAPAMATTDPQGKFTINALAPGRQRIVAKAEGSATSESIDVNLEVGKPTGELVLRLKPASRVSGIVTDGRNPVAGANVALFKEGGGGPRTDAVSQADGSFVIEGVARGRVSVVVQNYQVKEPKMLTVDKGELTGVQIVVDDMASVAGHVLSQGKPVAGARVFCGRTQWVVSETDGSYVVRGLTPDKYRVGADEMEMGAWGETADIIVAKGEHKTGIDIDLKHAASISGTVVEAGGKPLGSVIVAYECPRMQDYAEDTSAPDGTFRVRPLKGGCDDYKPSVRTRNQVRLRIADGGGELVAVKAGSGEVSGIRIVVQRDHLSIAGTTVDDDGQPMSDVHVDAYRSDHDDSSVFNQWVDHPSATSSGDGHFSIDDLDGGSYVVQARAGDGSEEIVRGVSAGQKNLTIKVHRAGAIDGTLVGFSNPPSVQAIRQLPGAFPPPVFATVDGTGFVMRGLSPGRYQIAAMGGETDAQMVDVGPGQTANVTLKSRGSSRVKGKIVNWATHEPVPGLRCNPGLRTQPAFPMWIQSSVAYSDDNGAFEFDDAPAGPIAVQCMGTGPYWSNGRCEITATPGQDVTCEVPVVKIDPDAVWSSIGAQIMGGPMPPRFNPVTPGGPAARAGIQVGDILSSIDGASVLMLTPWAASSVLFPRPPGSTVHLGLTRGDKSFNADIVTVPQ